ncbi:OLC1v1039265C2 [Oldenlandia corymbosa var. corymbosa]|nr:OLC1v1039265C2 [Oldenlandia corymbosa var. corymbosa]
MSNMDELDKSAKVKIETRPPRLGVGAIVPRETKVMHSNDPVERRLRAKLVTSKTKAAKHDDKSAGPGKGGSIEEDTDDDELESKTKLFERKRPVDWSSSLQAKKQHR